jgi:hypothetical protein
MEAPREQGKVVVHLVSGNSGLHFVYERGIAYVGVVLTFLTSTMQELTGTAEPTGGKNAANDTFIAATAKKRPPPESPESIQTRTLVIFSFWVIVITLGLPTWWWTTSIYRARLPFQEMLEWADGKVSKTIEPLLVA